MMKKKLVLLCASLLSTVTFAASTTGTTVSVPKLTKARPNQTYWIYTNHAYAIFNDSGVDQNLAVCMTTILCYDAAPQHHKIIQSCDRFLLHPGESKNNSITTTLPFSYPFVGYCDVTGTTEAFGWQHSLASDHGKLKIAN
jgi:hypothetical protein